MIGLFVILTIFIILGIFNSNSENFTPFIPYGVDSIFLTTGIIFVSFLGITQLAAVSEEVKDPSRNLPRAFIASVGVVTVLYAGIMLVLNGVLPLDELVASSTPLIEVASMLGGSPGRIAIIAAGFFATVSTANAAILSSSRFPFAMGRDKLVPDNFVEIHEKFGTPARAIVVTGGVMILFLLFFDVEQLAKLGSTFNVLIFALVNLSVIFLRRVKKEWYQPSFRDPLFPLTQIFGIAASLFLIPQLGLLSTLFSSGVIGIGVIWYLIYGKGQAQPEYGLLDIIDEDQVPVSIEENKKKVMVSIGSLEHEKDLLRLANMLGDVIVGLHIQKVPPQTGLEDAQEAYTKKEEDRLLIEEFEEDVRTEKCRYLEVFSHDVSETIIHQAEREYVDLLIMGWHGRTQHHLGEDIPHQVMAHAHNHLAILKGYLPEEINNILVPFGGGDSSRYAFYLGRRLARATGAQLKLLRVISPETAAEDRHIIEDELRAQIEEDYHCDIDYEIKERFSVKDGTIAASEEADLMIIGDTNKRFKRSLVGDRSERIVRHARCPALLVKRYRPISKRGIKSYIKRKVLNRNSRSQLQN